MLEDARNRWHPIAAAYDLPFRHVFHGQLLGREFAVLPSPAVRGVRHLEVCGDPAWSSGACAGGAWSAEMFGCDGSDGGPCGWAALPIPSDWAIAICCCASSCA